MVLDKKNILSMRMSSPTASEQELRDQLKTFTEVAEGSGFKVIKKWLDIKNRVVEVEGAK